MDITSITPITVRLSRRNLQTLLNKLDRPGSRRTLVRATDHGVLVVIAEDDDTHYGDCPYRTPGPVYSLDEP